MKITITSKDGTKVIKDLVRFEGLKIATAMPGGYDNASFTLSVPVTESYPEYQPFNRVHISHENAVVFEGYIDTPTRTIRPDKIDVKCLGWSARLNELGTSAQIVAGVGGYKMSDFITNVILADADIELVAGDIYTGDYSYPVGAKFDFNPYRDYNSALQELNKGNNLDYAVWEGKKLHLTQQQTAIKWLVLTKDCQDLQIQPNPEVFANRVVATYELLSMPQSVTVNDATSQAKYQRVVTKQYAIAGEHTTADATAIANTYLSEVKDLKVAAELTCNRVFDINRIEQPLSLVRAGDIIRVVDWLPQEEVIKPGIVGNDVSTFRIKSTDYDDDPYTLRLTPVDFVPSTEIQIARTQVAMF